MIDIHCPYCGSLYHADESHVGKSLKCQKSDCGRIFQIEIQSRQVLADRQPVEVRPYSASASGPVAVSIPAVEAKPQGVTRSGRVLIGVGIGLIGFLLAVFLFVVKTAVYEDSAPQTGAGVPASVDLKPIPPLKLAPLKSFPPLQPLNLKPIPYAKLFPPCALGHQPERLVTGERIEDDEGVSGRSELKISNGTSHDAAVRVVDNATSRTARFFYMQVGDEYILEGIEQGAYQIRWASGFDWVPACKDFLREAGYSEAARPLWFKVELDDYGREISATRHNVTLYVVPGGNLGKRAIDRKRFLEGDQHVAVGP